MDFLVGLQMIDGYRIEKSNESLVLDIGEPTWAEYLSSKVGWMVLLLLIINYYN